MIGMISALSDKIVIFGKISFRFRSSVVMSHCDTRTEKGDLRERAVLGWVSKVHFALFFFFPPPSPFLALMNGCVAQEHDAHVSWVE